MGRRIILGLSVLAMMAASCQLLDFDKGTLEYTAALEQLKPSASEEDLIWTSGGYIWMSVIKEAGGRYDSHYCMVANVTDDGKTGTVVLEEGCSSPKSALYPYYNQDSRPVFSNETGEVSQVKLLDEYSSYEGSVNPVMLAEFPENTGPQSGELMFRHLTGILKVSFRNVPAGVNRFEVIALDKGIAGSFDVDMKGGVPEVRAVDMNPETPNNTVEYILEEKTEGGSSELSFYIPLPTGEYNGFRMKLYEGTNMIYTKTFEDKYDISRGVLSAFPQLDFEDNENDYNEEYVDLGLSVLWATKNIGAATKIDNGLFFAWGEVSPRSMTSYNWENYKWGSSITTMTKYCSESTPGEGGFTDNLSVLEPEDDAAVVNWGGDWRMPTEEECQELIDGCDFERINNYEGTGVNGTLVIGKGEYADHSIFFPAAGIFRSGEHYFEGQRALYWSSTVSQLYLSGNARALYLLPTHHAMDNWDRYHGMPVRPVRPKNDQK